MNFASTNARSLAPKIGSAIDYINELDLDFLVITETWLRNGRTLENNVKDLELGTGISIVHRAREGRRGGGVGILYKPEKISLKQLPLKANNYEVVAASGKFRNNTRRICIIAVYVPPDSNAMKWEDMTAFLVDNIFRVKVLSLIHI